jgi:nitroreductase
MTEFDLATVDRLLTTTRAVRRRLDLTRPVGRDVILECLRLAIQAPTGTNAQRWRWLVIEDAETKARLAELYNRPEPVDDGAVLIPADPEQARRMAASGQFLSEHLHEVPVFVIPCTEKKGGAAGWQPSIYPAVWSFMLALRSRGLGSVITTRHLYHQQEAAALLGVPEGYAQSCLVPVAYYTGKDFRAADRRPPEEMTFFGRWGQTV